MRQAIRQPGNEATRRKKGGQAGTWERGNGKREKTRYHQSFTFPPSPVPTFPSAAYLRPALTLVELMVVVVILGILATTVTLTVRDHLVTGKRNAAKQELSQIAAALELYYLENDRYPTNEEGLAMLVKRSEKHPDGLLQGGDLNDPWNHPYQYVCPGLHGSFDLVCWGADGREGGTGADADLVSWELK